MWENFLSLDILMYEKSKSHLFQIMVSWDFLLLILKSFLTDR